MKNIFKNKLLIILVLIALFITTMCSSAFAESGDVTFSYNDTSYTISSDLVSSYPYVFIIGSIGSTNTYEFYYSSSPFTFKNITSGGQRYCYVYNEDFYVYRIASDSNLNQINTVTAGSGYHITSGSTDFFYGKLVCVYTSHDVYDRNNNLVFQGAPQVQTPQVELMKPTQVEEILPQMIAVVEIVLPIFLGIFGILLVLYLIKSNNLLHL